MPRLSIIIPVLDGTARLETTLVSVLENRPRDCEIIVVLTAPYDDPYKLADEICFLPVAEGLGLVACLNAGIQASRSPVIHLLSWGLEVAEGWSELALAHFSDQRVASVALRVVDALDRRSTLAAGLDYSCRRGRVVRTELDHASRSAPSEILGPVIQAGFYRRAALELVGGLSSSVGDSVADADLALSLRYAGYRSILEPMAVAFATRGDIAFTPVSFKNALAAERLFWRAAPVVGWRKSLLAHPVGIAGEFASALPRPSAFSALAGRMIGACQFGSHFAHHQWLLDLRRAAGALLNATHRRTVRMETSRDAAQATVAPTRVAA